MDWVFWGTPYKDFWKIENQTLTLDCLKRPIMRQVHGFEPMKWKIKEDDCVSFIGKRQTQPDFKAGCKMHFVPENEEAAGLIMMQASNFHYRVEKCLKNQKKVLKLILAENEFSGIVVMPETYHSHTTETVLACVEWTLDDVILMVNEKGQNIQFMYGEDEKHLRNLGETVDGKAINLEKIGNMVGTIIGLFATANGQDSHNKAVFDWFLLDSLS